MKRCAFLILFAATQSLFAAGKTDLTPFKGTYSNGTTTISYSGMTYSGTATQQFSVGKSGRSGTLSVAGTIVSGGSSAATNNAYTFSGGNLTIQSVAPLIEEAPVAGTFRAGRKSINGSGVYSGVAPVTLGVQLRTTKRRAFLTTTQIVYQAGIEIYRITYTGSKRVRK